MDLIEERIKKRAESREERVGNQTLRWNYRSEIVQVRYARECRVMLILLICIDINTIFTCICIDTKLTKICDRL